MSGDSDDTEAEMKGYDEAAWGCTVDSSALDCVPFIGEHVGPSSFWSMAVFGTITYWAQQDNTGWTGAIFRAIRLEGSSVCCKLCATN